MISAEKAMIAVSAAHTANPSKFTRALLCLTAKLDRLIRQCL
jgi:hypothetical protein